MVVTAVISAVVSFTAVALLQKPAAMDNSHPVRWAYATPNELVVERADAPALRIDKSFIQSNVVWTHGGGYLVALWPAPDTDDEGFLLVLEADTGRQERINCSRCVGITAVGGTAVVVAERSQFGAPQTYRRISIDHRNSGADTDLGPTGAVSSQLFSGLSDSFIVVSSRPGDGAATLTSYDLQTEQETQLFYGDLEQVSPWVTPDGNDLVAVASNTDPAETADGSCLRRTPAVGFVTAKGRSIGTALSLDTSVLGENEEFFVQDMWWGRDGRPRIAIGRRGCLLPNGDLVYTQVRTEKFYVLEPESMVWQVDDLDGSGSDVHWNLARRTVRELDDATWVQLDLDSCPLHPFQQCEVGTVSLITVGDIRAVSDGVRFISVRPLSKAASPPTAVKVPTEDCRTTLRSGEPATVVNTSGALSCADAVRIYVEYQASPRATAGNINLVQNEEWRCISPTAGSVARTGVYVTCDDPGSSPRWSFDIRRPD
ncbi:hypothetical protein [Nocardia sp. NPDC058497]|uniref:hypothetical protein n=1 Tax=Nocardia sp. NPDC058497 TaxID=3346529 RepID=UPI003664AB24